MRDDDSLDQVITVKMGEVIRFCIYCTILKNRANGICLMNSMNIRKGGIKDDFRAFGHNEDESNRKKLSKMKIIFLVQ